MSDQHAQLHTSMKLTATIRGRVQGVGFRAFVYDAAQRLQISGYVRNVPDGSVYVVGHADHSALEALLAMLRQGPFGARVTSVDSALSDDHENVPGRFEVRG